MTTIDKTIVASADDAAEAANGSVNIIQTVSATVDATNEYLGLRWDISDAPIPAGATITTCTVTIHMPTAGLDEPNHTVRFEELAAPALFVAGSATFTISGRAMTTASVTLGNGGTQGAPVALATPDMSAVLQEVVDSQGELTSVVAIIQGGADGTDDLAIDMVDGATGNEADLHIEYTSGGGGDPEGSLIGGKLLRGGLLTHGVLIRG